jgi:hypothetical protein
MNASSTLTRLIREAPSLLRYLSAAAAGRPSQGRPRMRSEVIIRSLSRSHRGGPLMEAFRRSLATAPMLVLWGKSDSEPKLLGQPLFADVSPDCIGQARSLTSICDRTSKGKAQFGQARSGPQLPRCYLLVLVRSRAIRVGKRTLGTALNTQRIERHEPSTNGTHRPIA